MKRKTDVYDVVKKFINSSRTYAITSMGDHLTNQICSETDNGKKTPFINLVFLNKKFSRCLIQLCERFFFLKQKTALFDGRSSTVLEVRE